MPKHLRRWLCAVGLAGTLALANPMLSPSAWCAPAPSSDSSAEKSVVAVFHLESNVTESPGDDLSLFGKKPTSLRDLLERLRKASTDANVKAVAILPEGGSVGHAQAEELRQAIDALKAANKPVYVFAEGMDTKDYALYCGATRLSVIPTADLWITGMAGESLHLKGLLDKLGVKPDFLHCGAYKSAHELFTRTEPSPEADKMMNWLYDGIYDTYVDLIAKGRKLSPDQVKQAIDNAPYTAEKAKEAGLIDAVEQRQDFEAMLKQKYGPTVAFDKKYGEPKEPQVDLSSPFALFKLIGDAMSGKSDKKQSNKPAVAVVYVDGAIALGKGESSPFGSGGAFSTDIRKALEEAAEDSNVKAVVLRVDSPGGSATASEVILDATKRVKAKKPFVVSMGDVAGSGGYYVACASDTIFADRSTITASIGVVGGKFITTDMWNKVGVNFHEYRRGKHAGLMSTSSPWTDEERGKVQGWMDEIYGVFKDHVTQIRGNRLKKPIDELAGGRVFTGQQALELGLIDKIGTMQDATEFIASAASLKAGEYEVRVVPEPKNFLERLFEESGGGKEDPAHVLSRLAIGHTPSLVDLAMPYLQGMDPQRVSEIRSALQALQLMQREGVIMMSPELLNWR